MQSFVKPKSSFPHVINTDYFYPPKNLLQKFFQKLMNVFGKAPPDFVDTPHNKGFMSEVGFVAGYETAVSLCGFDYRIPWRVHQAQWAAHSCVHIEGDFVELGTGRGFVMLSVLGSFSNWESLNKKIYLFDAFTKFANSGLGKAVHDHYYAENYASVADRFKHWKNVNLVEGDIRETLPDNCPTRISFLHIDLNDSSTEIEALSFLYDRVSEGGIILLDDYANRGEEKTYKDFTLYFSNKNLNILTVPSGQGIVIKR